MEGGEGAGGGLGSSGRPLAALATLRRSLAGTVQGPVTNHSHRSSDSAPRKASVLVPPEPLPSQGPRHRQLCPQRTCAKSQPPPIPRVQINWGGCHTATHLRPGNATAALSLETSIPPPSHPPAPAPRAFCYPHEEHRLPAQGAHPHHSHQLPCSKTNSRKLSAQNTMGVRGVAGCSYSALSPATSVFQKPQALVGTPGTWPRQLGAHCVSGLLKHPLVLKPHLDNFAPERDLPSSFRLFFSPNKP